ncbi:S-layer homology domain-containing protein [Paenibacillus sp. GCM10012306]|uniref:S-layer homology domain-containing protein n=1 Tax=Paenibacillus sp. GCM10012306 TaxID=3317342 RepID=UPI00360907FA
MATSAQLQEPLGVAIDSSGDLYIADSGNNTIRKVEKSTGIISTVVGTGTADYSGDGGAATLAQLNFPEKVAFDSNENMYIADHYNQRIRKVDKLTGIISTVAGTGTADYSGDGGAATSAHLSFPSGVAFDSDDNLYIAENGSNTIRKVDNSTGIISTVAGTGGTGFTEDGQPAILTTMSNVTDVAVDSSGNVYIADTTNHRTRKVDRLTGIMGTVAGTGEAGYSGDGGAATSAQLFYPNGVAVDRNDNVYIADSSNNRIRKVGLSRDASLSNLTLSSGTLSPAFVPGEKSYTASVPNSVSSITVTPTVSDSSSAVTVNGTPVTSGSASGAIDLNVGSNNTITVNVRTQDGTSAQTYTVTVERKPAATIELTAIAGNGQVTLNWGSVSEAVEYHIYQGTATGLYGPTPIATVGGATNSYTALELTNGTTYYFAVQASNATGSIGYSKEVSAIPQKGNTTVAATDLTIGTDAPATGATQADGTNTFKHATAVVTWSSGGAYAPASGTYLSGIAYKTKYVLTADTGYVFDATANAYGKNGAQDLSGRITHLGAGTFTATVSSTVKTNDTLTIIVTWPGTALRTVAATDLTIGTDAPVTGATQADGTNTFKHATAAVTWSSGGAYAPASGTYLAGIAYKTKYVLTAAEGYTFDAAANAYGKNGAQDLSGRITNLGAGTFTATVSSTSTTNDTLTIIASWPATFQNLVKVNLDNTTYFQAYYNGAIIPGQGVNIAGGSDFGIELANNSVSPSQLKPVVVKSVTAVDDKGNNVLVNLTPDTTHSAWGLNLNIKGNSAQTNRTVTITVKTEAAYSIDKSFLTSFTGIAAYTDSSRNVYPNQYNATQYFTAGDKLTLSLSSNAVIPNGVQLIGTKTSKVVELTNTLFDTNNYKYQYTFTMPNEPVSVVVKSSTNANAPHNINVRQTIDNVIHPTLSGGSTFVQATASTPASAKAGEKVTIFPGSYSTKFYSITGVDVRSALFNEVVPVTKNDNGSYSFVMPYTDANVTVNIVANPFISITTTAKNNSSAQITSDTKNYYPGDRVSFQITNTDPHKTLSAVRFIRTSDNTVISTLDKSSHAFDSSISDSYVIYPSGRQVSSNEGVTIVAEFNDYAGIPVYKGTQNTKTEAQFSAYPANVLKNQPFTFKFTVPDDSNNTHTPQIKVTNSDGTASYIDSIYESTDSQNQNISTYKADLSSLKTNPQSITLVDKIKSANKGRLIQALSANSKLPGLFTTIVVNGTNMNSTNGDQAVYIGTSSNPTQQATLSNKTSTSFEIKVPSNMLPKDKNVTYYISANGVQKSLTIQTEQELSHKTFGVLAVVSSNQSHSVIIGADDTDINQQLGSRKSILTMKGKFVVTGREYQFSDTTMINSVVSSYMEREGKLKVTDSGNGNVTVDAKNVSMAAGGMTFMRGNSKIELKKGIEYDIEEYQKGDTGDWKFPNNQNIKIDNVDVNLGGLAVIDSGSTAKITGALLIGKNFMFEGKVFVGIMAPGGQEFGLSLNIDRLQYGLNEQGRLVYKGLQAGGAITPPSDFYEKLLPGFKLNNRVSIEGSIDTFEKVYGLGFDLDTKLAKIAASGVLKRIDGTFLPNKVKLIVGSEAGLPILPTVILSKVGGGVDGLADYITKNYKGIPPIVFMLNGQLDVGPPGVPADKKPLHFNNLELVLGPSMVQLTGMPNLLGIDLFKSFRAGLYRDMDKVSFQVDLDANILKNFEVILAQGKANVTSYSDPKRKTDFYGLLQGTVQIPKITLARTWFGNITAGPLTLRQMGVGLSNSNAFATFSILGFGLKADYSFGSRSVSVSRSLLASSQMDNKQTYYDEDGNFAGEMQSFSNIKVVATSPSQAAGRMLMAASSGVSDQPTIKTNDASTIHTITFPTGLTQDYAVTVTGSTYDFSITDPEGHPYAITFPKTLSDGSIYYDDPNANAAFLSDDTIMFKLGHQAGDWTISSASGQPFASAVLNIIPIPQTDSAVLDSKTKTVNWTLKGLDTVNETYQVQVHLSTDNGDDKANLSPGVLIHTINVDPAQVVNGGISGSYVFSQSDLSHLQSGSYYPRIALIGIPKDNKDKNIPYSSMNAKQALVTTNPLAPGDVSSVSVSAGGGGTLKAKWNEVPGADGYLVNLFDDQGRAVMSPLSYTDEIGSDGKATDNQIPHAGVPISYSISPDYAVDGAFSVDFSGMTPGSSYKIMVSPFSYADKTDTSSVQFYGNPTVSNVAFVPVPRNPVLNVTSSNGNVAIDEEAGNLLYVNGNFNLDILSTFLNQKDGTNVNLDSKITVLQSDGTINSETSKPNFNKIYSSADYESTISVPVAVSDTNRSSIIKIVAENQDGDKSSYSLVVHYNNDAPALFVNADSKGTIVTDQNGNYQIQGSTQPFITVRDNFGNQVKADERGNFTIKGTLNTGLQAYSTITVTDSFGNSAQDDVIISGATKDSGGSSSPPAGSNNSTSNPASQDSGATKPASPKDDTKTDDKTPSSGVVKSIFKDVHLEAPWAEQAIEKAYALGLVNGRSVDIFDPNSNTKRREAITILARAKKLTLGLPADLNKAALHFADWDSVPEWSKPSIAAAYVNGLISGSKVNGKFYVNSNSNITRAELAVLIQNAFKLKSDMNNVKTFSDDIPSWASESIAALSSNKAVSGYPDGTFKPSANATRAEMVVMLINVIKPE